MGRKLLKKKKVIVTTGSNRAFGHWVYRALFWTRLFWAKKLVFWAMSLGPIFPHSQGQRELHTVRNCSASERERERDGVVCGEDLQRSGDRCGQTTHASSTSRGRGICHVTGWLQSVAILFLDESLYALCLPRHFH